MRVSLYVPSALWVPYSQIPCSVKDSKNKPKTAYPLEIQAISWKRQTNLPNLFLVWLTDSQKENVEI
jgi:hypothetical protein